MAVKQLTFVDLSAPDCDAAWLNSAEKEINNTITQTSGTLSNSDQTQLGVSVATYTMSGAVFLDSGTAAAYNLNGVGSLKIGTLLAKAQFSFIPANTNTGAATLKINSTAAATADLPFKNINGSALSAGQIVAGRFTQCYFDGTEIVLLNCFATNGKLLKSGTFAAPIMALGEPKFDLADPLITTTTTCVVTQRYHGQPNSIIDGVIIAVGPAVAGSVTVRVTNNNNSPGQLYDYLVFSNT